MHDIQVDDWNTIKMSNYQIISSFKKFEYINFQNDRLGVLIMRPEIGWNQFLVQHSLKEMNVGASNVKFTHLINGKTKSFWKYI